MKYISNIKELHKILKNENPDWQKRIYDSTDILVVPKTNYFELFSVCGYIDLDLESDGSDKCEIANIDELVAYIKGMNSYNCILNNNSYGKFTKAELYWSIYYKVILPNTTDSKPNLCLFSIEDADDITTFHMALIDYDEVTIELQIENNSTLESILSSLVDELNDIACDIEDFQNYKVFNDAKVLVPNTYDLLRNAESTVLLS